MASLVNYVQNITSQITIWNKRRYLTPNLKLKTRPKQGEGRVENNGLGGRRPQTKLSVYSLNTKTRSDPTQSMARYFWKIYLCGNLEGGKMVQDSVQPRLLVNPRSFVLQSQIFSCLPKSNNGGYVNYILQLTKSYKTGKHTAAHYCVANNHHSNNSLWTQYYRLNTIHGNWCIIHYVFQLMQTIPMTSLNTRFV